MTRYLISAAGKSGSTAIALRSPLTAVEAHQKATEMKNEGYQNIILTNVETGEKITDVETLLPDNPDA